ncbi:MAG: tetratricopeptide repeat protein [Bacteroidota bacterium]
MIRKDPQYEQSYLNLGMLYLDQDSIEMAKKQFDMLIKISPLHIRAYYFRGVSQELSGNNDAALADYRQAVKLAPNFEAAIQGINRLEEVN